MMLRFFFMTVTWLSLVFLPCLAQAQQFNGGKMKGKDNNSQSIPLEGKWKVIGCQLNGIWLPHAIFKHFIYTFPDKGHFTLDWAELSFPKYVGGFPKSDKGTISLRTEEKPYEIDLIPSTGPYAGQLLKGIFEIDHDILKAIFAFPNHERPKEFSAGQGEVYEIWQRLQ